MLRTGFRYPVQARAAAGRWHFRRAPLAVTVLSNPRVDGLPPSLGPRHRGMAARILCASRFHIPRSSLPGHSAMIDMNAIVEL